MLPRNILRHQPRRFLATHAPTTPSLQTGIILTRAPILTRTPTRLEQAYYTYQARIHRALHNPFPTELWFKQNSPLETRFVNEELKRERAAFGKPFGMPKKVVDKDGNEVEKDPEEEDAALQDEDEESMLRVHTADVEGDLKSLDRKGQRHLYLIVKTAEDKWAFPQGGVEKGELFHEAAGRDLTAVCGPYMDAWVVSRQPIGVYQPPPPTPETPQTSTFFYKAHILAGQVSTEPAVSQVRDFAWLTKQELEGRLDSDYWHGVKDMLSDF
ncbi:hypothetical protein FIBSPDRAFT_884515 [Athelia psychrophila]|uniref:Large ribosomal subunit protein mL46 n=1 Tax=Athelia psychrophila TaxID=1759441 RepID=A0A166SUF0_9AGAM|nr:hypothetical protein FIBSPDRAFT_884515 [Fibularhizoctonia sp. CBS 109695]